MTDALQRDEAPCAQFSTDVSLYSTEMLVFLDETETDRRDSFRKKGYSLRGKPARSKKFLVRGEHIFTLCLISTEGILVCKIARGSVNGDTFLENLLMPNLVPFNGDNPRNVVIMDNCSFYNIDVVTEADWSSSSLVSPILS